MESIINLLQKLIDPFHPTTIHQYMLLLFIITSATIITSKKKINTYAKQYSIFQNYLKILKKIMSLIIESTTLLSIANLFTWLLLIISTKHGKKLLIVILYSEWNLMFLITLLTIVYKLLTTSDYLNELIHLYKRNYSLIESLYYLQTTAYISALIFNSNLLFFFDSIGFILLLTTFLFFCFKIFIYLRNKEHDWRNKHKKRKILR